MRYSLIAAHSGKIVIQRKSLTIALSSAILLGAHAAPPVIDLSNLSGTDGVLLDNRDENRFGHASAFAGDFNHDGVDDLLIGAYLADNGATENAGATFIFYGNANGFPPSIDPSSLDGSTGTFIKGRSQLEVFGFSVSGMGDFDGDGIDDIIVGAYYADPNELEDAGEAYVIFGREGGLGAAFDLNSLDGSNGFAIPGLAAGDQAGISVSSAGDVNNDGIPDLLVGAPMADTPQMDNVGKAYVVFGSNSPFSASLDLSLLDGNDGFVITGEAAGGELGRSVSEAGDVNGDGIDDIIIDQPRTGRTYVLFGSSDAFSAQIDAGSLDATTGIPIDSTSRLGFFGRPVGSAGDFNGDGADDIVLGSHLTMPNLAGAGYVIYGSTTPLPFPISITALDGSNGVTIPALADGDMLGVSVSGAGDFNGDGLDDIVLGANSRNVDGAQYAGEAYVVFGRTDSAAVINLDTLNGVSGTILRSAVPNQQLGSSVAGGGDLNADGIADVVVGAPTRIVTGGKAYVVFGPSNLIFQDGFEVDP